MAQLARVDQKEVIRREDYLRENQRPRELRDPFTWPWPYRAAGTAVGLCVGASHMHNLWLRKPWHYALYARLALTATAGIIAFSLGNLRVNNYQTREAVTEHYKELHPNDFDAVNDIYGRPFANVLLPWYPKRTQYRRFDD
uniref:Uncharacterized protein n=1 Tax=Panagrolaimus sp. ES5 TaxID=591445 RepID=A0AC34GS11_9BILA